MPPDSPSGSPAHPSASSTARPRAAVAWSSGKDAAWALRVARAEGALDVVALLTTLTTAYGRVSMHGVRESVLRAQAAAVRLPLETAWLPAPCSNAEYERCMESACERLAARGVTHVIFGDLFLEDVRSYRERQMARAGLTPVFPLWGRDTAALAREMVSGGLEARLVCVDPRQLPAAFAGRVYGERLLAELPAGCDPCGERGEFHSCVTAGPFFRHRVEVVPGRVVERDGFIFADVELAPGRSPSPPGRQGESG